MPEAIPRDLRFLSDPSQAREKLNVVFFVDCVNLLKVMLSYGSYSI